MAAHVPGDKGGGPAGGGGLWWWVVAWAPAAVVSGSRATGLIKQRKRPSRSGG